MIGDSLPEFSQIVFLTRDFPPAAMIRRAVPSLNIGRHILRVIPYFSLVLYVGAPAARRGFHRRPIPVSHQ
jgi:hypothetical protein